MRPNKLKHSGMTLWLSALGLFLALEVCHASDSDSGLNPISPVYEEMLAHEIVSLIKKGTGSEVLPSTTTASLPAPFFGENVPFSVLGWTGQENELATRITESLKRNYSKAAKWETKDDGTRYVTGQVQRKQALEPVPAVPGTVELILLASDNLEDWQKAAAYIGRPNARGFLIIFSNVYMNRTWLDSTFEIMGLRVLKVMKARELEFVEDELGRQIVDLDLPEFRNQIYERLVREGMNPVHAHPKTDEAIRSFRSSETSSSLLIISKP